MIRGAKIVLGISGSIAAYKAYDLIRLLQKDDALLKCVLTANGGRFVNTVTLECLLQDAVYTDLWGDYPDKRAVHIALA